jgi:hypothetical protein
VATEEEVVVEATAEAVTDASWPYNCFSVGWAPGSLPASG